MLELLRYYKNVEMTHTFSKKDKPCFSVSCVKNTDTLQITFMATKAVAYYEDLEEAAFVIENLINEPAVT